MEQEGGLGGGQGGAVLGQHLKGPASLQPPVAARSLSLQILQKNLLQPLHR